MKVKTSLYINEEMLKDLKKIAIDYDCRVNDLAIIGLTFITSNAQHNKSLLTDLIQKYVD